MVYQMANNNLLERHGLTLLTPREREVFELIRKGLSSDLCAEILVISKRTVEVHRSRIIKKYKVRNISQLNYQWFVHQLRFLN